MSTSISTPAPVSRRTTFVAVAVVVVVAAVGLSWAKWLPYAQRAGAVAASGSWKGSSILTTGAGENPFARAWDFTLAYGGAVWKALLVALVVATVVDVLVPRRWLVRALGRRTPLGGSLAGGLASLPGMMCTCCTAPIAVTMRRAGVPLPAALAFWLGNPVLNPAVLVFLALLAPPSWVAVRLGVGILLVLGFSALVGVVVARRGARTGDVPAARDAVETADEPVRWGEVPRRLLARFGRLAVVLVPEYLVVVFVVGLVGAPLGALLGHGGALAVLLAALVATFLVLPTAGEIPILLGLAAAGASAGVLGALLIALPAVSLPSAIMVGRALGWRATAATTGATVVAGLVAGGILSAVG
ncbi:permease [Microlunatus spumicola]|uniref:Permease n=1 Tax=Microlunatus spumicola TaxID=81499 RepID=A0ABP6XT29_9ACTN